VRITRRGQTSSLPYRSHGCFDRGPAGIGQVHSMVERWEEGAVPEGTWSAKRERQYEHIKDGLEQRGDSEELAEEIAARTVNKERARHGESRTKSQTSTDDISSGRRGGLRSHRGAGGRTRDQLYEEAKRKGIAGRSKMTKAQLQRAVER
jgi:hypothetical protein